MKNALLVLACVLWGCTGTAGPIEDADTEEMDSYEESDAAEDVLEEPEVSEDTTSVEQEEDAYVPECLENVDCDDDDPCTVDVCEDEECVYGDVDEDGDGYIPAACGGTDCDDSDDTVNIQQCEGVNPCCDGCTDLGCWYDETTGYAWDNPMEFPELTWVDAVSYCESLTTAGLDWELPSISTLRTLVKGCPNLETGGVCGVTDTCNDLSCSHDCEVCRHYIPDDDDECYWDIELNPPCSFGAWSSTLTPSGTDTWMIAFTNGLLGLVEEFVYRGYEGSVICVNTGG